jgi:hypothetical protein
MAFVDGAHFQQERTEINMPTPIVSTSKDKKTIVVPVIKNSFLTMDYTDNVERLMKDKSESQYLYKDEDGKIIPEYFFWMQDDIVSSEASYDPSDISGIQLNDDGTSLAVWTESNTLYIYKRGAGDRKQFQWPDIEGLTNSSYKVPESQHHLTHKLEWILRMVVTPKEGRIGSTVSISYNSH